MFKRECKIKFLFYIRLNENENYFFVLRMSKRECLPQHLPYRSMHPRYPRGSDFVLFIHPRTFLLISINLKFTIMIVRLVIKTEFVKGKTEHGTPIIGYHYHHSAPMVMEDLLAEYSDWMRTHQNWFIEPLVVRSDF